MKHPLQYFRELTAQMDRPRILLTGAKVWPGSINPDHSQHAPNGEWIGTDIEGGEGVSIVSDLQTIHETGEQFDAAFSPATLEHIERPWVAMWSMTQVVRPGGVVYVHTHQTFPVHGYPSDYFRFSTSAMRTLCFDAGLDVLACEYDNPCTIVPPPGLAGWNYVAEAWLNVNTCAIRKED